MTEALQKTETRHLERVEEGDNLRTALAKLLIARPDLWWPVVLTLSLIPILVAELLGFMFGLATYTVVMTIFLCLGGVVALLYRVRLGIRPSSPKELKP